MYERQQTRHKYTQDQGERNEKKNKNSFTTESIQKNGLKRVITKESDPNNTSDNKNIALARRNDVDVSSAGLKQEKKNWNPTHEHRT